MVSSSTNQGREGWQELPLIDCTSDRQISYGVVQPGFPVADGVPIVRVNNLVNGHIITHDAMRIALEIDHSHRRTKLRGGELVLSLVGTTGSVAIVPAELAGWNVARAIAVIRPADQIGAEWLKLCLESSHTRDYLDARANTTVQKTLNLKDVRLLPIPLPPPLWRQEILSLVSPIDKAITNLAGQNRSLEAIACAIFKSWLVDFDPVRAKAEGREPEGMDAATAALFPSTFQESKLGEIPMGFRAGSFGDCVTFHNSKRVPLSSAQRAERHGRFPYYGAAGPIDSVDDFLFDGEFVLVGEDGTVIDPTGRPVVQHVWGQFWVSNHAHVLEPRDGWSIASIRHLLGSVEIRPYVTGAVQPKLSMTNLKRIPVVIPPKTLLDHYAFVVQVLVAHERLNSESIATLSELRDTLLPRLISGKLRVPEADKLIEAVV